MSETLIAPYLAAVALLAIAGAVKLARPNDTVGAFRSIGIGVPRAAVRAGSAAELTVALLALTTTGPIAPALIAISYVSFAAFVGIASAKGGAVASCGCFGEPDTPPTLLHALLNIAAAATAVVMAGHPQRPIDALPAGHLHSAMVLLLSATIAYVAYLSMAVLPKALNAGTTR
jgi:hypothetical protein